MRSLLELALVFFVIRTYAQRRTKGEASGRNFVKFSEKVRARPAMDCRRARLELTLALACPGNRRARVGVES